MTDDVLDKLPGDLKEVAQIIGLDMTMALVEHFGGTYIMIPKCEGLIRKLRDNEIRRCYNTGKWPVRRLALKFKLTDRRVSDILKMSDEDVPLPLLEIMQERR